MSLYLTADELAELTGYQPNQFARMRSWLQARKWPFEDPGRSGCPRVLRVYHDQRLSGTLPAPSSSASNDSAYAPNRARLEAFLNGRKKKNA